MRAEGGWAPDTSGSVGVLPPAGPNRSICIRTRDWEVTRVLIALGRALEREVYAPYRASEAWQDGLFAGPPGTGLLPGLWRRAVSVLTDLLQSECQQGGRFRVLLGRLNWDCDQLASVVLPYVLADGGHRIARMRRLLAVRGPIYARNWVLQIAIQRARKELDALGRRGRHEREAGIAGGLAARGRREAYEAALIADEVLPLLSPDHRRVWVLYSVHQFADPDTRKGRNSLTDTARHLTHETGESWTYHRVRSRHEEIRAVLMDHVEAGDGTLLRYVVATLTLKILGIPGGAVG